MRKTLNSIAGLVIGAALGAFVMAGYTPPPRTIYVPVPARVVSCSAEDSCTVDYRDGAWHIGPEGSAYAQEDAR